MYKTTGIYYSFLDGCLLSSQDSRQPPKKNKYQLLYTYGCTS